LVEALVSAECISMPKEHITGILPIQKKTVLIVDMTARQSLRWALLTSPGGSVA
jgi:hypothetical protein